MKAALVVNPILPDIDVNLATIRRMAHDAADARAELVIFGEAALTGLINNDDPSHDLPLGQTIPGPATESLSKLARERRIWLAIGLLERADNCLYDSAVLLAPDGEIALKYRRIQPQWHAKDANSDVYCQGNRLPVARIKFGTVLFLICGDLFDDSIAQRSRNVAPDYVLFPFSRNFGDGSIDQERWDREEEPEYAARASLLGATVLMVNTLEDAKASDYPSFGGAMVVSATGTVLKRWPLDTVGILYADV